MMKMPWEDNDIYGNTASGDCSKQKLVRTVYEMQNVIPKEEAIPIEWIKRKLLSGQYEYENDYDKGFDIGWNCAIKTLLKDWEKENGVKMGHWVKEDIVLTSYPPQYQWHCSECGETVHGFSDEVLKDRCPNCGIKMEKENETV